MRDTLKENTKQFATAEEEVTYESSGPQVKPHQWVEARNTSGKLHKLKSVLLKVLSDGLGYMFVFLNDGCPDLLEEICEEYHDCPIYKEDKKDMQWHMQQLDYTSC